MRDLPEKIDSKFRYVLLAAHRAEQMMRGAQPRLDAEGRKTISVAMDEVMEDVVGWDYGPEVAPDDGDMLETDALGQDEETVTSAEDAAG